MVNDNELRGLVLADIHKERDRQIEKRGRRRHTDGNWLKILVEEVGEVAQAMQKNQEWSKETDASDKYMEVIQVAAVAAAMAEQIKEERMENGISN